MGAVKAPTNWSQSCKRFTTIGLDIAKSVFHFRFTALMLVGNAYLCFCRNRAICPRSVAVCNRPPLEPASSKSC